MEGKQTLTTCCNIVKCLLDKKNTSMIASISPSNASSAVLLAIVEAENYTEIADQIVGYKGKQLLLEKLYPEREVVLLIFTTI